MITCNILCRYIWTLLFNDLFIFSNIKYNTIHINENQNIRLSIFSSIRWFKFLMTVFYFILHQDYGKIFFNHVTYIEFQVDLWSSSGNRKKRVLFLSWGEGGGLNGNSVLYRNFKGDNLLGRLFSDNDFFFKRHLSKKNYLLYTELKNLYLL